MTVVVFVGPTLSDEEVVSFLPSARLQPPIIRGDAYRWTRPSTRALVIIDGYFDHQLSVWHKEILWALAHGVRVYGAASVGALRAAELADFGMIGTGRIFESFRDGTLEDDDEVAVIHAGKEQRYRLGSDPMVNIRATLSLAAKEAVISDDTHSRMLAMAKALPYAQRRLAHIVKTQAAHCLEGEGPRLRSWLEKRGGLVDQKRDDALELLRRVASELCCPAEPRLPSFQFSHTEAWQELVNDIAEREKPGLGLEPVEPIAEEVLEETQLLGRKEFEKVWHQALWRALGKRLAEVTGTRPGEVEVKDAVWAFRERHGLSDPHRFDSWLAAEGMGADDLERVVRDEVAVEALSALAKTEVVSELMAVLRLSGRFGALARRAQRKSAHLKASLLPSIHIDRKQLLADYFEARHEPQPEELGAYANALGFDDEAEFVTAVAREHWFRFQNDG